MVAHGEGRVENAEFFSDVFPQFFGYVRGERGKQSDKRVGAVRHNRAARAALVGKAVHGVYKLHHPCYRRVEGKFVVVVGYRLDCGV